MLQIAAERQRFQTQSQILAELLPTRLKLPEQRLFQTQSQTELEH